MRLDYCFEERVILVDDCTARESPFNSSASLVAWTRGINTREEAESAGRGRRRHRTGSVRGTKSGIRLAAGASYPA